MLVLPVLPGSLPAQHHDQRAVVILQGAHLLIIIIIIITAIIIIIIIIMITMLLTCSAHTALWLASPSQVPTPGSFSRVRI